MKQELTASVVFSTMVVFRSLRVVVSLIFRLVNQILSAKVSLDRIDEFLHDV